MSHRIGRIFALSTVGAALAIGGIGAGTASAKRGHPEDGAHRGHHGHCKGLKGKKRRNCEKLRHGAHEGANHM